MPTGPESPDRLSPDAVRLLLALAEKHGESSAAILRAVQEGTPVGRLILKLCGLNGPHVRNGRPRNEARFKIIYDVLRRLEQETGSEAEAVKRAPVKLAEIGITGPSGRPLTQKAIRDVRRDMARYWFEPKCQ